MDSLHAKIYYCYKATNQVNQKVYIGFASDPSKRWSQHKQSALRGAGFIFHDAIRKHGWHNFQFEVVCCGKDKRAMLEHVEPQLIQQYKSSINERGYNMHRTSYGGAYWRTTDKRKPVSDETRAKISKKVSDGLKGNQRRKGCKDSEAVREKKSKVLVGNLRSLGRKHSPAILKTISDASLKSWKIRNHSMKLTEVDVKNIRVEVTQGNSQKQLAVKYNVSPSTIGEIVRRETWKHI